MCFVSHVGQGLVISELLKIIEAIIKGGVALSGLPPVTFAVAIYELCQIIVNIHILSFQRTQKSVAARVMQPGPKAKETQTVENAKNPRDPGCQLH